VSTLPKNILVVDEQTVRTLHTALLLKRLEYNVFVASSGHDMMRLANGILPNLIMLDLRMPLIEGHTCLEKLRSSARLGLVKVVMVSEPSDTALLDECLEKGAQAALTRPLQPTELYRTLQELTEARPRKMPRLRVVFKVTVQSGTTARSSYATMISENGIFVRTMHPLEAGTDVKLALELPSAKPLTLDGRVLYNVKYGTDEFFEPGMGICFTNLGTEMIQGLRKFVEDNLTGDLSDDSFI